MSTAIAQGLEGVASAVATARQAVDDDRAASPVTTAIVEEFARKTEKAVAAADREAVVELEQAGDCAKVAAEADAGLTDATRQAVLDAHLAICVLKAQTAPV